MSPKIIKLGRIRSLRTYLKQRNKEYKALRDSWLNGTTDLQYAPSTWSADRCMLVSLPAELLLLVCEPLYQADLFHLALTCRSLASVTLHLLYERDVARFDCLALRWACTFGVVPTLERALSYGAPADHVFTPHSHAKCAWVLGGPADSWDYDPHCCETPLTTAIVADEPEIVRLLLAHGADANAPNPKASDYYYTRRNECLFPINVAMGTPDVRHLYPSFTPGNPRIVRLLLDAGASPNQYTMSSQLYYFTPRIRGVTPLLMAMQADVPVDTVRLLLERGADPTLLGSYQGTFRRGRNIEGEFWDRSPLGAMLLCSVVSNVYPFDLDKIQLLLRYGGVNEVCHVSSSVGLSPDISLPVLFRHWNHRRVADVLRLAIAEGADIASWGAAPVPPTLSLLWWTEKFMSRCYRNGELHKIPETIAKACEVITLLAEATLVEDAAGPVRRSSIIDAVASTDVDVICTEQKDQTALRRLCGPLMVEGVAPLIPLLLRYGADFNSADSHGRTALHHAAMFGSGNQVRELVSFGGGPASSGLLIDALDARGWTPLHYACLFGFWDEPANQVTTARLLLEHGADIRARTANGWTPLALAIFTANSDLIDLLLDCGAHFKDAFIPRDHYPGAEPTLVPVGRTLFLRSDLGWPHIPELATELAIAKACTATLLSHRTGIPVHLPPVLEFPMLPSRSMLQRDLGDHHSARFGIDVVDHPFGSSAVNFHYLAGVKFEDEIEAVMDTLDWLGLEAWIASVSGVERPTMFWRGVRRR